ncbi:MAG: hypothetical protein Q4G49_17810, partial [Paracoccus sp. (in: a-proteobacteria)]|nr:hypothetical protein [Paracoccus sp. (in: a-proteobacteria)]
GLADLAWLAAATGWSGHAAFLREGRWALVQLPPQDWPDRAFIHSGNRANPALADFGQFGGTSRPQQKNDLIAVPLDRVIAASGVNLRRGAGLEYDVTHQADPGARRAGEMVMKTTGWIVAGVLVATTLFLVLIQMNTGRPLSPEDAAALTAAAPDHARILLEKTAQRLRTDRVMISLSLRLMIYMIAGIVALILVVTGAVMIHNRIEGIQRDSVKVSAAELRSTWPGLIQCGIGAAVICASMYLATHKDNQITVWDVPVFVEDTNSLRNALSLRSGMKPSTNGIAASQTDVNRTEPAFSGRSPYDTQPTEEKSE